MCKSASDGGSSQVQNSFVGSDQDRFRDPNYLKSNRQEVIKKAEPVATQVSQNSQEESYPQFPESDKSPYAKLTGDIASLVKPNTPDLGQGSTSKFDPEGTDYDYETAKRNGMSPSADNGHWGSVAPASKEDVEKYKLPDGSYVILKGKNHESWDKAVSAENDRGSEVKKFGDRYYSVPKSNKWTPPDSLLGSNGVFRGVAGKNPSDISMSNIGSLAKDVSYGLRTPFRKIAGVGDDVLEAVVGALPDASKISDAAQPIIKKDFGDTTLGDYSNLIGSVAKTAYDASPLVVAFNADKNLYKKWINPDEVATKPNQAVASSTGGGKIEDGNIDLKSLPKVQNPDGSYSTVKTITVEMDGKTYLLPTIINGKAVSNQEAIDSFKSTGKHLGSFSDEKSANDYDKKMHDQMGWIGNGSSDQSLNQASTPLLKTLSNGQSVGMFTAKELEDGSRYREKNGDITVYGVGSGYSKGLTAKTPEEAIEVYKENYINNPKIPNVKKLMSKLSAGSQEALLQYVLNRPSYADSFAKRMLDNNAPLGSSFPDALYHDQVYKYSTKEASNSDLPALIERAKRANKFAKENT